MEVGSPITQLPTCIYSCELKKQDNDIHPSKENCSGISDRL